MTVQLRAIAIYSNDGELREVKFRLGALNIVTGAPKTGKSALLDIVDYCWGRGECTVPEGEIRRGVSWFALHLDNDGEGVLLARRNPGPSGRASDEIFFDRGVERLPDDPSNFQKNVTGDGLRTQLSALLGISEAPSIWFSYAYNRALRRLYISVIALSLRSTNCLVEMPSLLASARKP
jgi:hypothetical protein